MTRIRELHAFIILAPVEPEPPPDLLLYETLRGQSAKYVLANRYYFDSEHYVKNLHTLFRKLDEKRGRTSGIREYVTSKEGRVATWETLQGLSLARSATATAPLLDRKYIDSIYVKRNTVEKAVDDFLDSSERRGLVITGASGLGRTDICCRIIRLAEKRGHIVLFFYGSEFRGENLIDTIPREPILYQDCTMSELLASLEGPAHIQRKKFIIIYDAVNEAADPVDLCRKLIELASIHEHPWFKIILTCRTVMWESIRAKLTIPRMVFWSHQKKGSAYQPWISLDLFTKEELKEAFEKYSHHFKLDAEFEKPFSLQGKHWVTSTRSGKDAFTGTPGPEQRLPWPGTRCGNVIGREVMNSWIHRPLLARFLPLFRMILRLITWHDPAPILEFDIAD